MFWVDKALMHIFFSISIVHLLSAPQVAAVYPNSVQCTEILLRSMKLLCIEGTGNEQQRSLR